ncbi:hypothetical protein DSL72_004909 [Monilinia vaccinii-corymbosi]|uniref:Peptidase S8/S53 domain-containing protein n=1 Tax=Monilinia vaccinii-corymbosi TaxID=61207 RepID=A0A8A3P4W6_9HELO|nr:hypothetical protein DSL72_004909 [Monilinia vaccinii-corymbosi]
MFLYNNVVLAFAACASAKLLSEETGNSKVPQSGSIIPGAYIVQFAPGHESDSTFYQNLSLSGVDAVQRHVFPSELFAGTSFKLNSEADVDKILSFDQVLSIAPVRLISLEPTTGQKGGDAKSRRLQSRSGPRISPRDINISNDSFTPHIMTGVDKLHKEGLDGRGVKIAILDTGIDFTLKPLGGGFGPGYKVAFGRDLVGNDFNGTNTPMPGKEPIDCNGHGTHVGGIIAAANNPYVLGVAPNVTLGMYKIFGCEGNTATDILINALIMAHNDGADIISASLGSPAGWPDDPLNLVVASIIAAGTPCIISAGNEGANGPFFANSPAAARGATSVGSVDNINVPEALSPASYSIDKGPKIEIGVGIELGNFDNVSLPVWAANYDTSFVGDGCSGFNASLTGKIVLIRRGGCTFNAKVGNAVAAGASYVLVYNNVPGIPAVAFEEWPILGVGLISRETGAALINALASGKEVTLTFTTKLPLRIVSPGPLDTQGGGFMSTYTTWGLANDLSIAPVISAPGGNILSTFPSDLGGWAVESGTSMSAPYIAGVVALYMQSKGGKVSPQEINAALASTATPVNYNDGSEAVYPFLASVGQQGAGLVNAYAMVHSKLTLSKYNLPLNDTTNFVKKAKFTIKNTGSQKITYSVTHEPAMNVYVFNPGQTDAVAPFPGPFDNQYSGADFKPESFSLSPNEQKDINVFISPSSNLKASQVPLYSGFVKITTSAGGNETYRIPYAGVATSLLSIPVIVPDSPFINATNPDDTPAPTIPFNGTTITAYKIGSSVSMFAKNSWALRYLRFDIVGVNITNKANLQGLKGVGAVPNYPDFWYARDWPLQGDFNGTLANGKVVKPGVYKFVMRAEKAGGVFKKGEYEQYDSDNFYMG